MLQGELSAILSTFIKLPFIIKIFVLSIFEWPFYTGFTVHSNVHIDLRHQRHSNYAKSLRPDKDKCNEIIDRHCLSGQGATKQLRGNAIMQLNPEVTDEIICQMAKTV